MLEEHAGIPMTLQADSLRQDSAASLAAAITDYYDHTWIDYRVLWLNRDNLAIHFGLYDETTHGHADALRNHNRVLADRIGLQPGERVLDAGCGVGGSAFWLAQRRAAEVVGITLPRSQVERPPSGCRAGACWPRDLRAG